MYKLGDVVNFFSNIVKLLKKEEIHPNSPLDEIALKAGKNHFAYIDNRRDSKQKYQYDLWGSVKTQFGNNESNFINYLRVSRIDKKILYSKSEQFPDFIFKVEKQNEELVQGSILELKDSKGGSIASFNSTLPTKHKSLNEIKTINGNDLVLRIASIIDGDSSLTKDYYKFERKCFYLVRTYSVNVDKVKISIVDGSFFETMPKEKLINQMFSKIVNEHIKEKGIKIQSDKLLEVEKFLSFITDQTIIAVSQNIEKASIRPRLRIMAEVHTEGNPHSGFYPEISSRTLNFIVGLSNYDENVDKLIIKRGLKINKFAITHKRNGIHYVFQYRF